MFNTYRGESIVFLLVPSLLDTHLTTYIVSYSENVCA